MTFAERLTIALAFAIMTCGCASAPVERPPSLSKLQSRSLPPNVVNDRIGRQLAEILIGSPPSGKPGVAPVRPLENIWYWTRARGSDTPDVCESDNVRFSFAPVRQHDPDASTPTRVSGISADTLYHLLAAPRSTSEYLTEAGKRQLQMRCEGLDPDNLHMISSNSADGVRSGALLFDLMRHMPEAQFDLIEFECPPLDETCQTDFRNLAFADIRSIDGCEPSPKNYQIQCTSFTAGEFRINVHTRWLRDEKEIIKVEATRILVMLHELID